MDALHLRAVPLHGLGHVAQLARMQPHRVVRSAFVNGAVLVLHVRHVHHRRWLQGRSHSAGRKVGIRMALEWNERRVPVPEHHLQLGELEPLGSLSCCCRCRRTRRRCRVARSAS